MDGSSTLDYSGEGLQFEMNRVDLLFNRALALKEVCVCVRARVRVSVCPCVRACS